LRGVSKDGRERLWLILRDAAKRPLLRMTVDCAAFAGTTSYIFLARFSPSSCAAIAAGSVTGYEQNVLVHANAAGPSG
jgi:hypothetical protein